MDDVKCDFLTNYQASRRLSNWLIRWLIQIYLFLMSSNQWSFTNLEESIWVVTSTLKSLLSFCIELWTLIWDSKEWIGQEFHQESLQPDKNIKLWKNGGILSLHIMDSDMMSMVLKTLCQCLPSEKIFYQHRDQEDWHLQFGQTWISGEIMMSYSKHLFLHSTQSTEPISNKSMLAILLMIIQS